MAPISNPDPSSDGGRPLTPKEARFVEEYLVDVNGSAAAARAGYSKKTGYVVASRLLKKVQVQRALKAAIEARSKRTQVTADQVLAELAIIGFSDIRHLVDAKGALLSVADLPDSVARSVSSVEVIRREGKDDEPDEYTHKVKLWDKGKALELIARHLGMLVDKVEHSGKNGAPLEVVFGGRYAATKARG